ncbi:MAG: hypothetical protein KF878_20105 [Planctomycetes bacterium]|nr:hypothetical protein [Planctomycetota bacterium]
MGLLALAWPVVYLVVLGALETTRLLRGPDAEVVALAAALLGPPALGHGLLAREEPASQFEVATAYVLGCLASVVLLSCVVVAVVMLGLR